jgi:ABC-type multidrug transport system ATPase subunit/small basic protein
MRIFGRKEATNNQQNTSTVQGVGVVRESALSHAGNELELVYRNLSYSVKISKKEVKKLKKKRKSDPSVQIPKEKFILKDLNGIFKAGRFTAILGASGAGKTTLLSVLAGEVTSGKVQGKILVNGEEFTHKSMKEVSGFVFQDDVLLETMTVKEVISMSALLRLPKVILKEERERRIDDVIRILHLQKAKNTQVGSPNKKGISGGERKRTSMAMEIVINPPMLFLDEPTSGLDTYTAYTVCRLLKEMANKQGRTVVATIHQPSSEIFHLFDDLLILAEGEIMYYGKASDAVEYFGQLGYHCPRYTNPSDYIFMNILKDVDDDYDQEEAVSNAEEGQAPREPSEQRIKRLLEHWRNCPEHEEMMQKVNGPPTHRGIGVGALRHHASFWTQFSYLFGRASRNAFRNKSIVLVKLFQSIFIGVILGLVYININNRTPAQQIQDTAGVLFFIAVNQFFGSSQSVLAIFSVEKNVFFREYGAGYYSLHSYYFSKVLVEMPLNLIFPFLLVIIAYYMIGLNPAFSAYLLIATFAALAGICGTVRFSFNNRPLVY